MLVSQLFTGGMFLIMMLLLPLIWHFCLLLFLLLLQFIFLLIKVVTSPSSSFPVLAAFCSSLLDCPPWAWMDLVTASTLSWLTLASNPDLPGSVDHPDGHWLRRGPGLLPAVWRTLYCYAGAWGAGSSGIIWWCMVITHGLNEILWLGLEEAQKTKEW